MGNSQLQISATGPLGEELKRLVNSFEKGNIGVLKIPEIVKLTEFHFITPATAIRLIREVINVC
jgi:hypothetical protein